MSERPPPAAPIPDQPAQYPGVTISLAPPMFRYSLRARTAATLETLLGATVPETIGTCIDNVCCLGPDEWLYRSATLGPVSRGEGLAVSVTDVSDRSVCFVVEGARAAALLMTGCPLDLDRFAVGRATRTIYETVEVIVIRPHRDRFEVEVWRSFAPWLWTALTTAAGH